MNNLIADVGPTFLFVAKILIIFFMVIYSIFSVVIVRQVGIMTKTLELGFEGVIKVFAYLQLLFAIGVLLISVLIL